MTSHAEKRAEIIAETDALRHGLREEYPFSIALIRAGLWERFVADRPNYNCNHTSSGLVRYRIRGGTSQARTVCAICGDVFGSAVRWAGELPDWDAGKYSVYLYACIEKERACYVRYAAMQAEHDAAHKDRYGAYLETPQWRAKRRLVMDRAKCLCEGCGSNPATQVHHLSYAHIFDEFLFELVALCEECHSRIHDSDERQSA